MRGKTQVPGTFGMTSMKSMQGRNVDSKSGSVVGNLVKIQNKLMTKVLSITDHEGGEACKEGLVVLIRIVVAVDELG